MLYFYRSGADQWVRIENFTQRYKETKTWTENIYEWNPDTSRTILKKRYRREYYQVWVDSGGTTVAGDGGQGGTWVWKYRNVPYWT